jgi:cyclophilin family peptidyl-prolyl cis-trans isomerase
VVFGEVVEGMEIVKAIEKVGSASGKTSQDVSITNAGVVKAQGGGGSGARSGGADGEAPTKKQKPSAIKETDF